MTETQRLFSDHIKAYHGELLLDEPLARHCTFRIGGPGEVVYTPHDEAALLAALAFAREQAVPCHVLGNGSNVLIADEGLRGITLLLVNGLTDLMACPSNVCASSRWSIPSPGWSLPTASPAPWAARCT